MSFTSSSLEDEPDQPSGTTFTVSMPVCERPRTSEVDAEEPEDEGGTQCRSAFSPSPTRSTC